MKKFWRNIGLLAITLFVAVALVACGTKDDDDDDDTPSAEVWVVTFDSNGGSFIAPLTPARGAKITEPAAPTLSGYIFGGWYKDSACATAFVFATDTVTANITLYAKWSQRTLASIAVTTAPTETTYYTDQLFDPAGMVVTATYSDGTTAVVSNYSLYGEGALLPFAIIQNLGEAPVEKTITIRHTDQFNITKETAITVDVIGIVSMELSLPPEKMTYEVWDKEWDSGKGEWKDTYKNGDLFDPTGMVMMGHFADGATCEIKNTLICTIKTPPDLESKFNKVGTVYVFIKFTAAEWTNPALAKLPAFPVTVVERP